MTASTQLNLLLIEDSDDDAELVVLELQRSGYDFHVTRTCTEAGVREALSRRNFTLVISDYRMPGFLGADALAIVQQHDPAIPFIVVSGTIGEEVAVDLIRAGANDYVMKGNLSRLASAVVRELGRVAIQQEHRRVRHELERSRDRLVHTVEIAPVGVCHNDVQGYWTMVNQSFCDMVGYSAEELMKLRWIDITHPDDREAGARGRDLLARRDSPTVMLEKRYVRKDGSVLWVLLSASSVRGADDEIEYFVTVVSDITDRRRAQEEVRRRARQQEAIAIFGHMALAGCTLEMLRDELTVRLMSVLEIDFCDVYEREPGGLLRLVAGSGWPDGLIGTATVRDGYRSHAGYTLDTGLAVAIDSLAEETRFAVPPLLLEQRIVSGLIIPVAGGEDGQFATIGIYSRETRRFDVEDESFLRACANIVAEAFQRQKNEVALRRHARQQTALAHLASRLLREPAERVINVCDVVATTLNVEYAAFLEIDLERTTAVIADGATWLGSTGATLQLAGTQTAYTIAEGAPVVVNDYASETRFNAQPYFAVHGIRSGISVPVRGRRQLFGVIKAATRQPRQFAQDDILFLQALADLFAEALERCVTHRELNASRERYRNVLEGAAEIIVSLSTEGQILTLNKAFERITGWPVNEWLGRSYLELVVEDDRKSALATLAAARHHRQALPGITVSIRTASGGERELEVSAVALEEQGTVVEIFAFGRDVTERRRIEEARARLAEELALILNSVGEGIYGFDMEGRCTMMNRAAADMLGHEPGAAIGTAVAAIHVQDAAAGVAPLLQTIAAGKSAHVSEAMFTTVEGGLLPVEFSASPLIANDAVVGGVVCFSDISRRRQLEAQLEQERRLGSLGKLAASVAHEFNNVLMGIAPFADIIASRSTTDGDLVVPAKQIRGAVQRGKRITDEILRFANPTPPAPVPFDVDAWIGRLEAETRNLLTQRHELEIDAEPNLVIVGDAPQLSQVALNLILNGRDAMPNGGRLSIKARRGRPCDSLRFALAREAAGYVHLSVHDSGTGIAREHLDHIFEPLFTTKRSGTGLGLPISRQIVKQHQGEMFVETEPGNGTTFHIFVPHASVAAAAEPEQNSSGQLFGKTTVLLVEDDPHVAAGLRLALESEGVVVHHVSTGHGALRAMESFSLDAAIIDVGLPDIDGTKVFEEGTKGRKIPVIFSTGHADHSRIAPYLTDGSVAYLRKPYPISVLLDTLAGVLR